VRIIKFFDFTSPNEQSGVVTDDRAVAQQDCEFDESTAGPKSAEIRDHVASGGFVDWGRLFVDNSLLIID
jgi:hypothetical protein